MSCHGRPLIVNHTESYITYIHNIIISQMCVCSFCQDQHNHFARSNLCSLSRSRSRSAARCLRSVLPSSADLCACIPPLSPERPLALKAQSTLRPPSWRTIILTTACTTTPGPTGTCPCLPTPPRTRGRTARTRGPRCRGAQDSQPPIDPIPPDILSLLFSNMIGGEGGRVGRVLGLVVYYFRFPKGWWDDPERLGHPHPSNPTGRAGGFWEVYHFPDIKATSPSFKIRNCSPTRGPPIFLTQFHRASCIV